MTLYYLYKDNQFEHTCAAAGQGIVETFAKAGCVNLTESEFVSMKNEIKSDDTIIVYISLKNEECHKKLQSVNCKKILHSMDESKSDQILFRTQMEFCTRHGVKTMINTFPSQRNIEFLTKAGISTITMPFSGWHRKVNYENKKVDVLVSGQIDESYYPIRCKIFSALRNSNIKYYYLPHSGMESSRTIHQFYGQRFFDLLDVCWTGVTCRAGAFRDRLVPKYVEFGFSKVLPIGDCPSYMHEDMSSSMISINENDDPDKIVFLIKEAISDKQKLIQRIEKYSSHVYQNYDMKKNVDRTISMILNNQFDTIA